ncbi:hypothetical protein [Oceanirhabdus sp. W0125-5]|uniref:hypothetical protein n=1 Tax=Oceanirhabdus sp. W0125-5 TaxID=2999116 RepID=UPI0022F2E850|nr:hypothetical protein [Oceanirhabdus sp. W0125-5]WBW95566.1 hypothetical protein OW730_17960 [Oceanirhabdus sp. W0125-5]
MDIKKVFRPTLGKVMTTLCIYIFLPIVPVFVFVNDAPPQLTYYTFIRFIKRFIDYKGIWFHSIEISWITIISLFITYCILSIINYYCNKEELKIILKKSFKISKLRMIIFIIGMTTIPYIILDYIVGLYGGTSSLPSVLSVLRDAFDLYFDGFGIPISIFTFLFFKLDVFVLSRLLSYTQITYFYAGVPSNLSETNIVIFILILSMIIVEWYLLAGLFTTLIKLIKKKRQKTLNQ